MKLIQTILVPLITAPFSILAIAGDDQCSDHLKSLGCSICMKSESPAKLGTSRSGFALEWSTKENPNEIYTRENMAPVQVLTNYQNGEVSISSISNGYEFTGEIFNHPKFGPYIFIKENSKTTILKSKSDFFVKFEKNSLELQKDEGKLPLYTLRYRVNYHRKDGKTQSYTQDVLTSCLSVFPLLTP